MSEILDQLVSDSTEYLFDHDEFKYPELIVPPDLLVPDWPTQSSDIRFAGSPNAPFSRTIREGMRGDDVKAVKRAISRWDPEVYPWHEFTDFAGEYLVRAFVEFKRRNFSQIGNRTPVFGERPWNLLTTKKAKNKPGEWAFDKRAIQLAREFNESFTTTPEERIRKAIVSAGFFWYSNKWQIAYSQARPMAVGRPPFVPSRWDCSGFVTNCHYAGGAPDPNGRGYDGLGYTGTLMGRGTRVGSIADLEPGDLIFYGFSAERPGFNRGDPGDVKLYVGDEMVLSMGSYPMKYVHYRARRDINHFRKYKVA